MYEKCTLKLILLLICIAVWRKQWFHRDRLSLYCHCSWFSVNVFPFLITGSFCVAVLLPTTVGYCGVLAAFSSQLVVAKQHSTIVPGSCVATQ